MSAIGRFHELSIPTHSIREAVERCERLGFAQTLTNDAWPHPYGVLTDGDIAIGLHERKMTGPALSFVLPDVAAHVAALEARGVTLSEQHTSVDAFNFVSFCDPGGQPVRLLEARTYSPPDADGARASLCGQFEAISLPERDLARAAEFWQRLGLALQDEGHDRPWPCSRLQTAGLTIELHKSRTIDLPVMIFGAPAMPARIEALRLLGIELDASLPRGLDPEENALIEMPEGFALLLMNRE